MKNKIMEIFDLLKELGTRTSETIVLVENLKTELLGPFEITEKPSDQPRPGILGRIIDTLNYEVNKTAKIQNLVAEIFNEVIDDKHHVYYSEEVK